MAAHAAVAFLWHFHQPDYRDPGTDIPVLPWVRLHASRAYYDLAWLHQQHPALRSTVNFVPILVEQLQALIAGQRDLYWQLSHKPARDLTPDERAFVVERFFAVHLDHGIRPRARYHSLYQRRERGASAFDVADLRDLQVLFNLAWFGYAARVEYPFLAEMEKKGRDFREDEKRKVLDLQIAVARRILPLWRSLAERGQVELTTTPYAHPILPLIIDTEVMIGCQPKAARPPRFSFPEDAAVHVEQAITHHQGWTGAAPVGCWPAEGAVGREAATLLATRGLRWLATDEAQLWRALPAGTPRGALYQPWRLQLAENTLDLVFRDRTLSDLIGFSYARNPPEVAARDLITRIRQAAKTAGRAPLVVIALDGENPWDSYPQSGRPFLENLLESLASAPDLETVCLGPYLAAHPPSATLSDLPAGSWINGDFGIWIGDPIDNTAWRLLGDARRALEQHRAALGPEAAHQAYHHLLVAEGSDWFWWYGEPFRGEHKADFDHLFRARVRAAWLALGQPIPEALHHPLEAPTPVRPQTEPDRFLHPRFAPSDSTWFEWAGAGVLPLGPAGSAMHANTRWFLRLLYGFDLQNAYFRFEPAPGADFGGLRLALRLNDHLVELALDDESPATLTPLQGGPPLPLTQVKRRAGLVELGIPFADLGLKPNDPVHAAARLLRDQLSLVRYPAAGDLSFKTPDADFEASRWTA